MALTINFLKRVQQKDGPPRRVFHENFLFLDQDEPRAALVRATRPVSFLPDP